MKRIALGLNLSIEKQTDGWLVEFSGGVLVLHWRFVYLIGGAA